MPRLLSPGLGDLLDRASILLLKVKFARQAGRDVEHFEQESTQVLREVARLMPLEIATGRALVEQLAGELAAVNAQLWVATDDMRASMPPLDRSPDWCANLMETATLGVKIMRLNDERCRLVGEIDRVAGTFRGEEKL